MPEDRRPGCVAEGTPEAPTDTPTCEADAGGPPIGSAHASGAGMERVGTFESLTHKDFRFFLTGALISNVGTWMQVMALGWLVYELTKSELSLGLVNFLSGLPTLFLILFAGTLADRVDRRNLLIWLQAGMMLQALAFAALTSFGTITISWVYGLTLVGGIMTAFMFPAWQAMVPDLVPRRLLLNGIALNSAQFNGARLLGPMFAALVLRWFGVAEVFWVNAFTFLFVIYALWVIRPAQEIDRASADKPGAALAAGLSYARSHPAIAALLLTATMMTLFGMPFMSLMPIIAAETLKVGSDGYSALMAANGGGALVGALWVASRRSDVRRDVLVRWSVLGFALALIGLALSRSYVVSLPLLAVMGAAFMTALSSINTSLQAAVPHQLRGRIISLFVLSFMGLMPVGALLAGALGRAIGATQTIGAGAIVLLAYAVLLHLRPRLLVGAIE